MYILKHLNYLEKTISGKRKCRLMDGHGDSQTNPFLNDWGWKVVLFIKSTSYWYSPQAIEIDQFLFLLIHLKATKINPLQVYLNNIIYWNNCIVKMGRRVAFTFLLHNSVMSGLTMNSWIVIFAWSTSCAITHCIPHTSERMRAKIK